jgi:hypothetical protein
VLRDNWTREGILREHGHKKIQISRSSDITNDLASGDIGRDHKNDNKELRVKRYLKDFANRELTRSIDPRYFFKNANEYFPEVLEDLEPNRYFEHETFSHDQMRRDEIGLFVLGATNTSTFWHAHTHAYRVLLYGATRWFLLPPYTSVSALESLTSMQRWLGDHYDTATRSLPSANGLRPLECVQRAGEVTFVPTGWLHAIINLEPVVGIAYEVGDGELPPEPDGSGYGGGYGDYGDGDGDYGDGNGNEW